MSKATEQKLAHLAERASTPRRKVSPMQVAAQLLEESAARCNDDLQQRSGSAAAAGGRIFRGMGSDATAQRRHGKLLLVRLPRH
ncbi:MAG TPA: hypothetical protein VG269_08625 [Tepidisphaeraceae bacterium]|jgi:hypothetical protein|nr:hypothetical protein [Tepidisphaeraceae bacterium]